MKILFLHGWKSVVGGRKPTYLADAGNEVFNPSLPDDDFGASVAIAERVFAENRPDVIVGSSRGGAVAVNMRSERVPLVLLCPAWKNWGTAESVKRNSVILHSRKDDVIPFSDSEELIRSSHMWPDALIEVGDDHRLADPEPLRVMLASCEKAAAPLVDATVYYLEMIGHNGQAKPSMAQSLEVTRVERPSVVAYRRLYDAVGGDYDWLTRRKMTDEQLLDVLSQPGNELFVLKVNEEEAGFAELVRTGRDVELKQFGLMRPFIGRGLGKWFLQWTIDHVFSQSTDRFWLHTCSLDHPAALPNYRLAGFKDYDRQRIQRER